MPSSRGVVKKYHFAYNYKMKYNLIPSGEINNSVRLFIYVLPASFDGSSYSIAYPECKIEDILVGRLTIRIFDGCPPEAILEITSELKERLKKKQLKYSERINTFFTAGIGILILGIINWIIPDPLPLVDELIFTVVGGITVWKAWKDKKVKLPLLTEQTYRYGYDNFKPDVETDSILTTIFKSIRCRIDPLASGEIIDGLDPIEIESLWMIRYFNIQDLIASGVFNTSGLEDLADVIDRVLTVKKLVKLEERKQSKRGRSRLHRIKQDTIRKTGISRKALEVYIEFYRVFLNYSVE